ncbi:hypothetical protein DFO67_11540 [Modicisalibacter xianhensis]|uniref:Uncharacterized protein n=1 Tax=Modicisalibacter xianhensis TaxID=442341 RepID=A0A4R8FS74_9GAMM|nr:hypothetical protein [Halomonas xianhensis]TDX26775.1 hypothetical protein DFO67_11540 [Halomonas xianhensis]
MYHLILEHHDFLPGIAYWLTQDVTDHDSGTSNSTFATVDEAITDATAGLDSTVSVFVADLTAIRDVPAPHDPRFADLIEARKVPLSELVTCPATMK